MDAEYRIRRRDPQFLHASPRASGTFGRRIFFPAVLDVLDIVYGQLASNRVTCGVCRREGRFRFKLRGGYRKLYDASFYACYDLQVEPIIGYSKARPHWLLGGESRTTRVNTRARE